MENGVVLENGDSENDPDKNDEKVRTHNCKSDSNNIDTKDAKVVNTVLGVPNGTYSDFKTDLNSTTNNESLYIPNGIDNEPRNYLQNGLVKDIEKHKVPIEKEQYVNNFIQSDQASKSLYLNGFVQNEMNGLHYGGASLISHDNFDPMNRTLDGDPERNHMKVEIKEEVDEDSFTAAFTCVTNLLKGDIQWNEYQGHVIKDEPEEDLSEDLDSSIRGRKRKRISYAEEEPVIVKLESPDSKRGKKRKKVPNEEDFDVVMVKDSLSLRRTKRPMEEEKEFSDDVKDMCNCQCKICHKVFLHHRMIKHIERTHKQGSKDKFTFLKLSYYRCKICNVEILFSYYNIGQHVKRCHQLSLQDYKDKVPNAFIGDIVLELQPENSMEPREYTDDLTEMCQCKCNICDKVFFYHQLRLHVQRDHKETMDVHWKIEFVKRTYYKCKICDEGILFHFDSINRHLYTHKVSLKDYKANYPAFSGQEKYKQNRRANEKERELSQYNEKLKRKRKCEFDAASVQKWSCTLTGTRKYYSNNVEEMCMRRCRLCDEIMMHDSLKYHIAMEHKEFEGNATNMDLVRLTHHKCKVCQKDVIFTYNSLSKHTKRWHKINFKEYVDQFNPFDDSLCDLSPLPEESVISPQVMSKVKPIARKSAPKSSQKAASAASQAVLQVVPKVEPGTLPLQPTTTTTTTYVFHNAVQSDQQQQQRLPSVTSMYNVIHPAGQVFPASSQQHVQPSNLVLSAAVHHQQQQQQQLQQQPVQSSVVLQTMQTPPNSVFHVVTQNLQMPGSAGGIQAVPQGLHVQRSGGQLVLQPPGGQANQILQPASGQVVHSVELPRLGGGSESSAPNVTTTTAQQNCLNITLKQELPPVSEVGQTLNLHDKPNGHQFEDQTKVTSDEDVWYNGNSFQCLQCGFMSRSLEHFTTHVKGYHDMNVTEFSPYMLKTNAMYRCQFCHQEVYHEKSVIINHLALHNIDIDSYSSIYERQRTLSF